MHVIRINADASITTLTGLIEAEGGEAELRDMEEDGVMGQAILPDRETARIVLAALKAEPGVHLAKYHHCTHDQARPQPCVELDEVPEEEGEV